MESISQGVPVIVDPRGEHKATMIFMHGLEDQGYLWANGFRHDVDLEHVKIVCPHSAARAVTYKSGEVIPCWFDVLGVSPDDPEDADGIQEASRFVHSLIDAEIAAGIPAEKIIVAGFSIGGALAIYSGLTYPKTLGAIIGYSSYLLQRTELPGPHTANNSTKIFMGHGGEDPLLPLKLGKFSEKLIKRFNPNVEFHIYPEMGHTSCPQEMQDVVDFIKSNVL